MGFIVVKRALAPLLSLALIVGFAGSAFAQQFDPRGIWEPSNKESKYEFTLCGEDNQRLCAELIWIREDKKDARNTKYLNTYMFKDARQTRQNFWNGTVSLEGFNIGGTVTQTSANAMQLKACALFVICENISLTRVQ